MPNYVTGRSLKSNYRAKVDERLAKIAESAKQCDNMAARE